MFDFDKFVGSKFYSIFDYIYKFTVVNLLLIITNFVTLFIFGIFPSLISAGIIMKDIKDGKNYNIFKSFFMNFKYVYRKAIALNFIYIFSLLIFSFNVYYFYLLLEINNSFIIYFGLFLFLGAFILTFISCFQSVYIFIFFPYLSNLKIIKYSFIYILSYPLKSLIFIGFSILYLYIITLFIYLLPIILISIYLYVILMIYYNEYKRYITKDNNYILCSEDIIWKCKNKQFLR